MKKNVFLEKASLLGGIMLLLLVMGCGKMDDTYRDFVKDGRIIYVGKADSVTVLPGRDRLVLTWVQLADPKVTDALVYWNSRTDSLQVDIPKVSGARRVVVPFDHMDEGTYQFEIFTFDSQRNKSVKSETLGMVYGDRYEETLLSRLIEKIEWEDIERRDVELIWGGLPDTTVIGSEVQYHNGDDELVTVWVPATDEKAVLLGVGSGALQYRTVYLPSTLAIDTFYTAFREIAAPPGNPVELGKEGWVASASSEDTKGNRLAANTIDNNPGSLWVNSIGTHSYPHTLTVDLGSEESNIFGVTLTQRYPFVNPLRSFEVAVSSDQVAWLPLGLFEMSNSINGPQYFDFPAPQQFRYFRIICIADYGNSANISLAEAGVYRR